jgi:hypothetical protein
MPQLMLDGQGRFIDGSDLDVTSGQSTANAQGTVTTATGLKRRILYVTAKYSANVTVNVTVTLISALGSAWNTLLATLAFSANANGLWVPPHDRFIIAPGDQLQVVTPAGGGGVTSAIAIYDEILGVTQRAVDQTS